MFLFSLSILLFSLFGVLSIPPSHNRHHSPAAHHNPTADNHPTEEHKSTQTLPTETSTIQYSHQKSTSPPNHNQTSHKEILSCFAKIRTSMSLNGEFREQFDTVIKIARMDQIETLLRRKITDLCSANEKHHSAAFLQSLHPAVQIAANVFKGLSNDERDHLNVWNNLNDTESEQRFYRAKFDSLPFPQQETLRSAYNAVLRRITKSSMPTNYNNFLSQLDAHDISQLQLFAREDAFDSIRKYISEKLQSSESSHKKEMEDFVVNAFNKVTIASGSGARQYELSGHHHHGK